LNALHKSEVIKSQPFLVDFLKLADRDEWDKSILRQEKIKYFNVLSVDGKIDVRCLEEAN
jgi:hypothetical protein